VDLLHIDTVILRQIYALIVVEHASRRVYLAGITAHPTGASTTRAARNPMMDLGNRMTTVTFLLHGPDFTTAPIPRTTRTSASPRPRHRSRSTRQTAMQISRGVLRCRRRWERRVITSAVRLP
jgi:hypothetical protein